MRSSFDLTSGFGFAAESTIEVLCPYTLIALRLSGYPDHVPVEFHAR
ncbi:MAG: hypothetical protein KGY46_08990 [Anaerolineales bacterium]|nr:hypothetical protein [Anaerolineales bacterium]